MKMFRITLRNNVSTGIMSTMAEDEKAAEVKAREWFATNNAKSSGLYARVTEFHSEKLIITDQQSDMGVMPTSLQVMKVGLVEISTPTTNLVVRKQSMLW